VIELIGLSGIICEDEDGGASIHVHYAIADKKGNCFAGHVNKGNEIFATADIVIGEIEGIFMGRAIDPKFNLPLFSPRQL
jgi:predicted DNA-binding protein with PD1-like motif